ncbi:MAG: hypothetical protein F6J86_13370 [Symploca sp. SIO1B1]|nr:hypothetical protein [Symploca sp. SIO2D2]NER94807.1 hypothetical protein [Symploca sp. SIO1B1]
MQGILVFAFFLGALWDATTSFLGIVGIFGITEFNLDDLASIGVSITAVVGSGIVLALSLFSSKFWDENAVEELRILRYIHMASVFFDGYTSYLGTAQNIILRKGSIGFITIGLKEVWANIDFEQQLILLFLTFVVTISPIMLPRIYRKSF